jgi:VIT1/CCC1 family predicted Fe2+/Mn2+ transporter
VAPFLFLQGSVAIWLSFALAMLSHFAVGAARSIFTGRRFLRSGLEMFAVGMGVAAAGYIVGDLVMRWL